MLGSFLNTRPLAEYRKYAEIKKKRHKKLNWFKLSLTFIVLLFFFYFLFRENSVKRDQLILYRIIGNDLPPRHKEGQTLSNLQFILDHEPPFPNTRKIFLLNRISDPANEAAIVRLLDQHQMEYIRVPFDEKEYEQLDFQLESFPDSDFLHSDDYRRYSKVAKLRILDFMYHTKNLYAMNNNGGRNTAIQHGKSIENAQWILPFDGNCYLSYNGFKEITEQLEKHGKDTKYFIVPMTRLLNNSILLNNLDQRPKAPEEPQIIFRYDAKEEYNLNMRYGRRSKLELLWRLGALESRQLNRPTVPWEPVGRPYSDEKGNFKNIGWVFRLFSGNPQQEENKKEASSIRAFNRLKAIQSTLDSLDEKIARRRFGHERLFLYSDEEMNEIRFEYWSKNPEVTATVTRLEQVAEKVLEENQMRPSTTQDHVKMDPDRDILAGLSQNVTILTLANYFLGNEKYGQGAANLIRMHFLNEYEPMRGDLLDFLSDQGYAFPNRQVSRKYSRHRTLNTSDLTRTDLSSLLDCIRLLRRREWLTHREYVDLQATMAEFLEYLITSPTGIHLAQMSDYRGVLYDLQVTSMAAFTDDVRLFLRVANRCRMRIGKGFKMTYVDDKEDWRVQFHYTTLSLQYWTSLARGIQHSRAAKEIWHYTAANGNRISHAVVDHLQSHLDLLPSLSSSEAQFVKSRLRPLAHTALAVFRQAQSVSGTEEDWAWLERHVGAFGSQWDKEQKDQGRVQGMLKFIRSEMKKGRSGLPPFWMLTVFN
ncbi:hypothetical protein G6F63_004483 [Rhizopus arrhizus]|nr:hypothetical protein G6F21_004497 [Rhizopus arrhizus]KAG0808963.1 hypothetical protein G6F20_009148 [Rhizopus arrhizus]KAG0951734.1 hypothetical protein G6F32_004777 [Rhizopus arrhizus]KAG1038927.1 hypothetical protein G6F25_005962 [Rhizopus arrhizus]KAG1278092.1 hypothetical protein G6F65_008096 [Rhizopus arrhizus]